MVPWSSGHHCCLIQFNIIQQGHAGTNSATIVSVFDVENLHQNSVGQTFHKTVHYITIK